MEVRKISNKGFSTIDLLVWSFVVGIILAFIGAGYVYLKKWGEKEEIVNEFLLVSQGLNNYYSSAMHYPPSGWDWDANANYAYVPQNLILKGWDYICDQDNRRIAIITPPIEDSKVRSMVYDALLEGKKCNEVQAADNGGLACIVYDKLCY